MLRDDLPDMIVGDLMRRWPASVPVLVGRRMACPGCLMARFMTVYEAAREHGLEPEALLAELAAAIEGAAGPEEVRERAT